MSLSLKLKYNLTQKEVSSQLIKDSKCDNRLALSKSEKKKIFEQFEQSISKNKFGYSFNYLVLGLLYDKNSFLNNIKRKGIFRYSKYLNQKCIIENLVSEILLLSDYLELDNSIIEYFTSIKNLSPIHKILKNIRLDIINEIRKFKKKPSYCGYSRSLIKTLLAFIDYLFLIVYIPKQLNNPNSFDFHSRETISEAVSFIIYLYYEIYELKDQDFGIIDEDYILSNRIQKIIQDACYFKKLQEIEIYVDHFSYKCIRRNRQIVILPLSPNFEKSIRLGYIRTDFQKIYDDVVRKHDDVLSLEEMYDRLKRELKVDLFKYTNKGPYPRYRIEIPEKIRRVLNEKFFSAEEIYREEMDYIDYMAKEQLLSIDKLQTLSIRQHLTLFDFLKIKRFFIFLYMVFFKSLLKKPNVETKLVLRSLVPGYSSKEALCKVLMNLASKKKVESFLDVVTWKPEKNTIFDLQYQSFVKLGNFYTIPVCVFANSNAIRNIYSLEYKLKNPKIFDDGKFDLMGELLSISFKKQGFQTFTRVQHDFKGGGDIDFLAINKNLLFIAECKKTLLPTNIFELRTLYNSIIKANSQLDLIVEGIRNSNLSDLISNKTGCDLNRIKTIKTAIITNSRIFVGCNLWKHPIRNIQEMINIIETGKVKTHTGDYSVWKFEKFSLDDLCYYLDDEKFHKHFYDSMLEKKLVFKLKSIDVIVVTYTLDAQRAEENFEKFGYRKID